jgi:hypothetical protein
VNADGEGETEWRILIIMVMDQHRTMKARRPNQPLHRTVRDRRASGGRHSICA